MMAEILVVVCEARADFHTSSELADRVFCDKIDWIEAEMLDIHRVYEGLAPEQPFVTWKDVKALSKEAGIRPRGFIDGQLAELDARQAQRAIRLIESRCPGLGGILLIRDDDKQTDRRAGLEQARDESTRSASIVIGLAHTKRECWVLAGFEPRDDRETSLLADVRQELGFDPRLHAHQLTAVHDHDKRSAKRVLSHLVGGDLDREFACWRHTQLGTLKERGSETGLTAYLTEVEQRLVPILGGRVEHGS
jgi:hypothetical protein